MLDAWGPLMHAKRDGVGGYAFGRSWGLWKSSGGESHQGIKCVLSFCRATVTSF